MSDPASARILGLISGPPASKPALEAVLELEDLAPVDERVLKYSQAALAKALPAPPPQKAGRAIEDLMRRVNEDVGFGKSTVQEAAQAFVDQGTCPDAAGLRDRLQMLLAHFQRSLTPAALNRAHTGDVPDAPRSRSDTSRRSPGDRSGGWWRRPFSVFQTNLQEIDAVMDVEKALDFIEGYGADTWLINTGGIASFYPTELSFQTRSPFLADRPSGDLIGDAVAAAHRRGIRVLSRLDFSKVSSRIAREHPDWLFVSPAGKPQVYNTLFSTCPSRRLLPAPLARDPRRDHRPLSGRRLLLQLVRLLRARLQPRLSRRLPLREMPGRLQRVQRRTGAAGRPGVADLSRMAAILQRQVIRTLTARIAAHITARRPDAALVLGRGAPIIYHEANNAFGRELWHHNTAEWVSAHVTAMPEIALMVNSVSFVDMPYRMAGEQPEHFAQYLLQAIARGGNPSTYIMGAPGRIPYANLPLAARSRDSTTSNAISMAR